MKEYIISIPEDSEHVITAVMEKFGVKATEVKAKRTLNKRDFQKIKKPSKNKIDHTYLFDKWKDFDIDAKTLREQSW